MLVLASRITQTSILADLERLATPPVAARNRRARNNKLADRFARADFLVSIAHNADLNAAHRSAKVAMALAFFAAVVEDVRLCDGAEDGAGCEGVDDAGAGEDAQVGKGAGAQRRGVGVEAVRGQDQAKFAWSVGAVCGGEKERGARHAACRK